MSEEKERFETYGFLEALGHRMYAGFISEELIAGQGFIRIDMESSGGSATKFFGPASIYCITPTDEKLVQAWSHNNDPISINRYELRLPESSSKSEVKDDDEDLVLDIDDVPLDDDDDQGFEIEDLQL